MMDEMKILPISTASFIDVRYHHPSSRIRQNPKKQFTEEQIASVAL
jgi:hypothetical protein